jgi:hypothetical protein
MFKSVYLLSFFASMVIGRRVSAAISGKPSIQPFFSFTQPPKAQGFPFR